ncbi:MAG: 4Fe-4S dicluster domain-containing protein [Bradyrhizobium sp.]|uniref:sulfate reduction electron transfer complex DsrMKJOP subunit DsrO n=1 Tax=Bradyrhizobium sp. TaxID=376 RepID=UPI0025C03CD3|nr:4Fe-4S dicluster domain-containing protein [Bradyrhizobium sp.]MBI5263329.1 4Fe-4S dicluster domain-containing protein [Bradyrhizobium sp.]
MSAESYGSHPVVDRRVLLRGAGGFLVTLLAPGVTLYAFGAAGHASEAPASSKVRWALLIDLSKCPAGCDLCVTACRDENGWQQNGRPETDPQWIRKVKLRDGRTGEYREVPVMCQHCDKPACVDVCPTGASFKRADGIVLVDKHICIGCRFCMMACPYKARSFVHQPLTDQKPWAPRGKGTVEACTFCVHRLDSARLPACVEACAVKGGGAMTFGDLNDPTSEVSKAVAKYATSQVRADLGLEPAVRYRNL